MNVTLRMTRRTAERSFSVIPRDCGEHPTVGPVNVSSTPLAILAVLGTVTAETLIVFVSDPVLPARSAKSALIVYVPAERNTNEALWPLTVGVTGPDHFVAAALTPDPPAS